MPIRAVLDTNILVSGLVNEHGAPRRLVDAWLDGRFTLVSSLYLATELTHVLAYPRIVHRLALTQTEVEALLTGLLATAEITPGQLRLPGVTRAPKDDAVVACAKEGQADYLVSGDRDLLDLSRYEGIEIVTPSQFVDILAGLG
jgi:hypothetical protein